MKAISKNQRISPKKANLIAALARNKTVIDALDTLKFTQKKAAPMIAKVIKSAAANAENLLKQKKENLTIKEIIITEGVTYKRSVPASRSRVHPIRKRNSHITVKLETIKAEAKQAPKKEEPKAKEEAKPEVKPEATTPAKKTEDKPQESNKS